MQNVQNFNKILGIMKIACYFVCSTVLNKLFHITEVYTPQDKIITEFIKWPRSKVYIPLNLNTVLCPGWSMTVFMCCDSCSWAVQLSTVLQKNPPAPAHSLFSSIFCICELFPTVTVWFWDPSFHTEGNWGTDTTITKRWKHFLMLKKETQSIKSQGVETFLNGWLG